MRGKKEEEGKRVDEMKRGRTGQGQAREALLFFSANSGKIEGVVEACEGRLSSTTGDSHKFFASSNFASTLSPF